MPSDYGSHSYRPAAWGDAARMTVRRRHANRLRLHFDSLHTIASKLAGPNLLLSPYPAFQNAPDTASSPSARGIASLQRPRASHRRMHAVPRLATPRPASRASLSESSGTDWRRSLLFLLLLLGCGHHHHLLLHHHHNRLHIVLLHSKSVAQRVALLLQVCLLSLQEILRRLWRFLCARATTGRPLRSAARNALCWSHPARKVGGARRWRSVRTKQSRVEEAGRGVVRCLGRRTNEIARAHINQHL